MKLKKSLFVIAIITAFILSAYTRTNFSNPSASNSTSTSTGGAGVGNCTTQSFLETYKGVQASYMATCGSCTTWSLTEYPEPFRTGVFKYNVTSEPVYAVVVECGVNPNFPESNCLAQSILSLDCPVTKPEGATETDYWEDTNTDTTPYKFCA